MFKNCECPYCNFSSLVDYYKQLPIQKQWIVKKITSDYDILECPKCGNTVINKSV
jgi:DNA-directed RNA polymerase subunit RPC12/RpoP